MLWWRAVASADIGADTDEELIGAAESGSASSEPDPELPPLRLRGSVAARIVALVVLVVLGSLFVSPKHWTRETALPRIRWAIALSALAIVAKCTPSVRAR